MALKQHGWTAAGTDADGAARFTHSKLGKTFQVGADGTLTNLDSGTKVNPDKEDGFKTDVSAKDAADYMKTGYWKKEGPGSRGSTKWYYDKHGHVQYGEPPEGKQAGQGEPGGGLKVGDAVPGSRLGG